MLEIKLKDPKDSIYNNMFYRILRLIKNAKRWLKHSYQKIVRTTHTSDFECWGLAYHMAKNILPKLKQFKKTNVNSFPTQFSTWEGSEAYYNNNKEEWEKETVDAREFGYEIEGWHKVVDEMIFAFEYEIANSDETFRIRNFAPKYGDTSAKLPKNRHCHIYYENLEDGSYHMFSEDVTEPPEGFRVIDKDDVFHSMNREYYYDMEMEQRHALRAQRGFELFGKYFRNLWD